MEAVAAVGVAAAAVQFFEFSTKTILLCKQILDSSTGSTDVNAELAKSTKRLTEMQKELRQAGNTPSSTYRQLLRTVQECSRVASELLQLLEDIRKDAQNRFGSMRSAIRAMKERKTVEKLQKKLADCQDKFQVAITFDIRQSVVDLLERQGKSSDMLQNVIFPKLQQLRLDSSTSHTITHDRLQDLGKNLATSGNNVQRRLDDLHLNQQVTSDTLVRGQTNPKANVNKRFDDASEITLNNEFWDSLFFDDMFGRQQSIRPLLEGTYEWVFTGKSPLEGTLWVDEDCIAEDVQLRQRILRWFHSDEPLFWINGKAGSGKTSLMSFIEGDKRTQEALKFWAHDLPLYTFCFFFWRPGSPIQKSITGLLRTILYQLTKAKPIIITQIVLGHPSIRYSNWTEAKLMDAVRIALEAFASERIFLLVDGLDEFDGDHRQLFEIVTSLQLGSHIKMCVSSRPESVLVSRLAKFPSISLQAVNYHDIQKYAQSQLGPQEMNLAYLIDTVARRSEGIFLWAVLVCKSLASGVEAGDDEATLQHRIESVPSGLRALFSHMFSNTESVHHANYGHILIYLNAPKRCRAMSP